MIELNHLFRERCRAATDIAGHLQTLHDLTLALNAGCVIELGVRGGESTVSFLAALARTGGYLWSCDIEHPAEISKVDVPICQLVDQVENWEFVQGDDRDLINVAPVKCDLLFIDTSHEYEHTKWELESYGVKVRTGGYIVCHDYHLEPVKQAVEEYLQGKNWSLEIRQGHFGLAIIRKK